MDIKLNKTKLLKNNSRSALLREYPGDHPESINIINDYWNQAKTVEDFKGKVFRDERLMYNRGYAQLSKESRKGHFLRTKKRLSQFEIIHAKSQYGLLKVGINHGFMYFPNGARWNVTRVYVINADQPFSHHMHWYRCIMEGTLHIYSNDKIIKTLQGKYLVCGGDTFVCFKEIDAENEDMILNSIG